MARRHSGTVRRTRPGMTVYRWSAKSSPAMTSPEMDTVTTCPSFAISSSMRHFPPRRIVCLTEETVETLYLLGEQDHNVGVSGYAVRPPPVRGEKPRVSAFISA